MPLTRIHDQRYTSKQGARHAGYNHDQWKLRRQVNERLRSQIEQRVQQSVIVSSSPSCFAAEAAAVALKRERSRLATLEVVDGNVFGPDRKLVDSASPGAIDKTHGGGPNTPLAASGKQSATLYQKLKEQVTKNVGKQLQESK